MDRNSIIEECAQVVDKLLRDDEATAQQGSVMAAYATSGYRTALRDAEMAIRALKAQSR